MERLPLLADIAKEVRKVYDEAVAALGKDLCGYSVLDLIADNFPQYDLVTLQSAIVVAGIA